MTAEEILNKSIEDLFKNVPDSIKTDFAKKMQCQNRTACLAAMKEYATEQIKKDRDLILKCTEYHNAIPVIRVLDFDQPITLD